MTMSNDNSSSDISDISLRKFAQSLIDEHKLISSKYINLMNCYQVMFILLMIFVLLVDNTSLPTIVSMVLFSLVELSKIVLRQAQKRMEKDIWKTFEKDS